MKIALSRLTRSTSRICAALLRCSGAINVLPTQCASRAGAPPSWSRQAATAAAAPSGVVVSAAMWASAGTSASVSAWRPTAATRWPLARSAAATYAPLGLRINAVAPGMTETPMTAGMLRADVMREGAGKQYPLGGVQTAAQVADTMVWLLSDGSARITGQVIAVDGGFTTVRPLVK